MRDEGGKEEEEMEATEMIWQTRDRVRNEMIIKLILQFVYLMFYILQVACLP